MIFHSIRVPLKVFSILLRSTGRAVMYDLNISIGWWLKGQSHNFYDYFSPNLLSAKMKLIFQGMYFSLVLEIDMAQGEWHAYYLRWLAKTGVQISF